MEDYLRIRAEVGTQFASEEAWRAYLVQVRWPEGFKCYRSGPTNGWAVRTVLSQCGACGRLTSVTAGTIFQNTRTPSTTWFRARWWSSSQKTGTTAKRPQQGLGPGSYETASTWLHKVRRMMARPGRDRWAGREEVDETYLGGVDGLGGRQIETKALIAVTVEKVGIGIGRIRMRRIPDGSTGSLQAFVDEEIAPGSAVYTDGGLGYERLAKRGYPHHITFLQGHGKSPAELSPRVPLPAEAVPVRDSSGGGHECPTRLLP